MFFRRLVIIIIATCFLLLLSPSYAGTTSEGIQVYQKSLHLNSEHKKKLADAITRYQNADNLWDVLRDEFSLAHYENNPLVQDKIEWYMNNQDFLLRSASRAAPYLYYILQQVKNRHLPAELVLLPIIESGYNPFAISNMGAAGIWQMMPGTASGLGVRQDIWYDGRRDVIASTRAALNYLAYLQSFFDGNWLLAIAAYNTGEGNVSAAIRKNIRAGRDTDYWSLPLAQQTRDYVPSLLALAIIISKPSQYPIYFPPVRNAPYLAQVDTTKQVSLKSASELAGINYKKLIALNPGFKRPASAAKYHYKLVLPIENVEQFAENLARAFPGEKSIDWIHYQVKPGETLFSISRKFKTSIASLRKMNHLSRTKNNLKRGTTILIPDNKVLASDGVSPGKLFAEKATQATRKALTDNNTTVYLLQPGDTIYMVRNSDSLDNIATRFHVSTKAIVSTNRITNGKIKSGDQLIIPTGQPTKKLASAIDVDNDMKPGDTIYMVRHGDTIEKIAKKFKTTASAIKLANFVDERSLFEGEKLIVPTHFSG